MTSNTPNTKMKIRNTSDFFDNEYRDYASYSNLRQIGSVIDGQKNAARKVLWYILQKNLRTELKVSQLDSKVAEYTEYLHGSMEGVIVNLAQNYTGTNNINLLQPEGNFGTRLVPEASASRYIYTHGTKEFFEMFNRDDDNILSHQMFEGHRIEPKFLLPVLPLLLVNGSEGVSSGFAQKILPRNPDDLKEYITSYLQGKKAKLGGPWYKGFKGNITQGESSKQWVIEGKLTVRDNKVTITELPIGYSLKGYKKILDKLEDGKVIQDYRDLCEDDFKFEVVFTRADLKKLTAQGNDKLMDLLKLRKKVTENFTVMDENNRIQVYDTPEEVINHYIKVKMSYLKKRKDYLISKYSQDLRELVSRYVFVKAIVDETLIITKRPDEDIIKDLDGMDKIVKVNDSYDYLLNMNIRSLTQKKMDELMKKIKNTKEELDTLKETSLEQMWLNDFA